MTQAVPTTVCPECGKPSPRMLARHDRPRPSSRFAWYAVVFALITLAIASVQTAKYEPPAPNRNSEREVIGNGLTLGELRTAVQSGVPVNIGIETALRNLVAKRWCLSREATLRLEPAFPSGSVVTMRSYAHPFGILSSITSHGYKDLRRHNTPALYTTPSAKWFQGIYKWPNGKTAWYLSLPAIAAWLCILIGWYQLTRYGFVFLNRQQIGRSRQQTLPVILVAMFLTLGCAAIAHPFGASTINYFNQFGDFSASPFENQSILNTGLSAKAIAGELDPHFDETAFARDILCRFDGADFSRASHVLKPQDAVIQLTLTTGSNAIRSTTNAVVVWEPLTWLRVTNYQDVDPNLPGFSCRWSQFSTLEFTAATSPDASNRVAASIRLPALAAIILSLIVVHFVARVVQLPFLTRRLRHRQNHNLCPHCAYPIPTPPASV